VALQSFEGGLVVVSHDRHLIKSVADTLWLVADGRLEAFDGDLDDYQQWLRQRNKESQTPVTVAKAANPVSKQAGSKAPRPRDPLSRLRLQMEQVEARIATLAAERQLLDAEFAADPQHATLTKRLANLERDVAFLESQWLEIGTAIEAAEAQICDSN
jgi:ATP-binding cassette, subfamily F, member 3